MLATSNEAKAVRKRYLSLSIVIAVVIGLLSAILYSFAVFSIASLPIFSIFSLIILEVFPFVHANRQTKKYKAELHSGNENLVNSKISVEIGEEEKAVLSAFWTLLLLIPIIPTVISRFNRL